MSEKELIQKDLEETEKRQKQEQVRNLERYHYLKDNGYILFETITGSQAHGTNTEKSDIDKAFVYILPENDILGMRYTEQLKIHKDFMGYEIRRFLELLRKGNPTVLELLHSPEDCVLIKHPAFDLLLTEKNSFITESCEDAFFGYARQQRTKAEGLEKLQNWEITRVVKKTPIDFCKVPVGYDAIPIERWLTDKNLEQKFCALSAVTNCKDLYAVFYDYEAHRCFSELLPLEKREVYKSERKEKGLSMGFGYKGIAFEDSNDIRLSNIPFEERKHHLCHMSYNKDGYAKHCKDYTRYQKWLVDRNEARWADNQAHGHQYDVKNMMHFMRLIKIGTEIAEGKGIQIRRPDAQELLKIRRGEVSIHEIFEKSDEMLTEMKKLFQNANLPGEVSLEFIHNLLVDIRKHFYKEKFTYSSLIENKEAQNVFFQKRFGNLSELQSLMKSKIDECLKEDYDGNVRELLDDYNHAWLNVITNEWPKENGEDVDQENLYIVKSTRDKVTVACGGDWQEGRQFDIVMWGDDAIIINVSPVEDRNHNDDIQYEDFLKQLGYEIPDESDED